MVALLSSAALNRALCTLALNLGTASTRLGCSDLGENAPLGKGTVRGLGRRDEYCYSLFPSGLDHTLGVQRKGHLHESLSARSRMLNIPYS